MKTKEHTSSWWKKELDSWFSKYIRLKYSKDGNCICYTCGYTANWKKLQNGHLATRFDERNCRPQCFTCNMYRNGMIPNFSANLEKELGEGITKELYKKAQEITKDYPYKEKVAYYKDKVEELINS